jgi:hypothetical protein
MEVYSVFYVEYLKITAFHQNLQNSENPVK